MTGVTYDAGALIAAERRNPRMVNFHELKQCQVEPLDETLAKQVGAASHKTESNDVVDISVVVSAMGRGDRIVASNETDITEIMTSLGCDLETFSV